MRADSELVEAARLGDPGAFRALYDRHRDRVRRAVANQTFHHELDDVVQETFARALEGLNRLRDADAFGPWTVGIAKRVAADLGRTKPRERCRDNDCLDSAEREPGYDQVEARILVESAFRRVASRDANALMARDGYGLPVDRVARLTGRTVGAERVQATRTRRAVAMAIGRVAALVAALRARLRVEAGAPGMSLTAAGLPLAILLQAPLALLGPADTAPHPTSNLHMTSVATSPQGLEVPAAGTASVSPSAPPVESATPPAPQEPVEGIPQVLVSDEPRERSESDIVVILCSPPDGQVVVEARYDGDHGPWVGQVSNCGLTSDVDDAPEVAGTP